MRNLAIIISLLLVLSVASTGCRESEIANSEYRTCEIVESYTDEGNSCYQWVYVMDSDGDIYEMWRDSRISFEVGREIVLEFDNCGTSDKTDDRIVIREKCEELCTNGL